MDISISKTTLRFDNAFMINLKKNCIGHLYHCNILTMYCRCINSVAVEDSNGRTNKAVLLYTAGDVEYSADDRKYQYSVVKDGCKV